MITLEGIARRSGKRAPMESLDSSRVSIAEGIEGDFRGKPGKRQVTVLSLESWQKACEEAGAELAWHTRRANLLIKGFEFLPNDVGSYVCIGDVVLEITRETDPCKRMDEAFEGLRETMKPGWRGGVCCRVVQEGSVELGDIVEIVSLQD